MRRLFLSALIITPLLAAGLLSLATNQTQEVQAALPGLNGKILFMRYEEDSSKNLYTMTTNGDDENVLLADPGGNPGWSGDGTKIILSKVADEYLHIHVGGHDGSDIVQVTDGSHANGRPAFSPDGEKIVFDSSRDEDGSGQQIYTMNVDGSNQQRITNSAADDRNAVWSPDGSKIAFRTDRDGNQEIYVMNTDGSGLVNITNNPARDDHPNWSPDGEHITFFSSRDGGFIIHTMNADGSNQTSTGAAGIRPAWSAEGDRIVYRRGGTNDIHIMDTDGSNDVQLTNNSPLIDTDPTVQPLTIPPATIDSDRSFDVEAGESVTFDTVSNHEDTYGEPDPNTVTITNEPEHGETTVDSTNGEITYTADSDTTTHSPGFFQTALSRLNPFLSVSAQSTTDDSLTYQICSDQHEELCTTETVAFSIEPAVPGLPDTGYGSNRHTYYTLVSLASLFAITGATYYARRKLYGQ